jgi:lysozyme
MFQRWLEDLTPCWTQVRNNMNVNPKFIDTSHYDRITDINLVKGAAILGVVNKVSEGPGMVDKTFAPRRGYVQGADMLYGGYHFIRPGNIQGQADHFLETVGDPTGLLLALDWEVPEVSLGAAKQWLQIVHDRIGRWPVVYSYSSMLKQMLGNQNDPIMSKCKLWLAQYSAIPSWPTATWPSFWAWQFTGDGNGLPPHNIPGVVIDGSRGIDINSYNGTDDQLRAEWAA